eukprot:4567014-Amphidinium_carterae.1
MSRASWPDLQFGHSLSCPGQYATSGVCVCDLLEAHSLMRLKSTNSERRMAGLCTTSLPTLCRLLRGVVVYAKAAYRGEQLGRWQTQGLNE